MNAYEIDDLLELMVSEGRRRFTPHYICERLFLTDIMMVTDYLLSLTGKAIIPNFEVECPNGDSDFTVNDPRLIEPELRCCSICGEEYVPDINRVWLTFDFIDNYIKHVKKKKTLSIAKSQSRLLKMPAVM